ncbi:hypothetical protein D3C85_479520 [compost metagenome]
MKKEIENLKDLIYNPSKKMLDDYSYNYATFSSNIKRFLPSIPSSKYMRMYQEVIYYQKVSGLEQSDSVYLNESKIINHSKVNLEQPILNKTTIFATFHLGSYRLLNCYLYEKGFKVVLIIDESVFVNQQEEMLRVCREELKGKDSSDMIILNVKDRASIFKLKQLIIDGYVMTVYLDGNTGINEKNQDFSKSYITINFLKSNMYVKNGIGKLAALLDAQFIPVVSYRDDKGRNHIEFNPEISNDDFESKQQFAVKTIEIAYNKLEEKLIKYPTQWECWLYIHKWFMRDGVSPYYITQQVENNFNKERYTVFTLNKSSFLFDMFDYRSYPIGSDFLKAIRENDFKKIDPFLFQGLIEKNIVI